MLKLCIACSNKVASTNRACPCGHVFSPNCRRIGGKRFSGYRVGFQRQSRALIERHQNGVNKTDLSPKKKQVVCRISPKAIKSNPDIKRITAFDKKKAKRRQNGQHLKENYTKSGDDRKTHTLSPHKCLRYALALAEINRRLVAQTTLWRMLPAQNSM
ncbi:uncharacterized protein LOC116615471 [Nematostella vectensis]|uniref:uncharacterized protein LOC116615471 n=1 Tax=Nematostella vectensis TaxID=45351 RepID=UPI0013903B2B|nr:uncharacterized protein LOC116615471 [Nematostella vectensis]